MIKLIFIEFVDCMHQWLTFWMLSQWCCFHLLCYLTISVTTYLVTFIPYMFICVSLRPNMFKITETYKNSWLSLHLRIPDNIRSCLSFFSHSFTMTSTFFMCLPRLDDVAFGLVLFFFSFFLLLIIRLHFNRVWKTRSLSRTFKTGMENLVCNERVGFISIVLM